VAITPTNPHGKETASSADMHPPKDISSPTSSPLPKVSKKLTQEEIEL